MLALTIFSEDRHLGLKISEMWRVFKSFPLKISEMWRVFKAFPCFSRVFFNAALFRNVAALFCSASKQNDANSDESAH